MNIALLQPFRTLRCAFSNPEAVALFEEIATRNLTIGAVWRLHNFLRHTVFGRAMIFGYGFIHTIRLDIPHVSPVDILAAAAYTNEKKEIERIDTALTRTRVVLATVRFFNIASVATWTRALHSARMRGKLFRLLKRLSKSDHFLTLCQLTAFICYYSCFKRDLRRRQPAGVLAASATHPIAQALIAAARSNRIPTLYSTHAACASGGNVPRMPADLLILDGEASRQALEEAGPVRGEIVYKGLKGPSRPLQLERLNPGLRVGFFLSAPVNLEGIRSAVRTVSEQLSASQTIVRPHPVLLLTPNLNSLIHGVKHCRIIIGASLQSCIDECDLVFSGNSNVHLDVLRLGLPTVYLSSLDLNPMDYYGFVKAKIVLQVERPEQLCLEMLKEFYSNSWINRYRMFDASYLEDSSITNRRIEDAVTRVLSSARGK